MTNNSRPRPLYRSSDDRILGGVAAGLADYLAIDPTAVRIGLVLLALVGGLAVPLYAAAWLLIPEEGSDVSIADGFLQRDVPADPAR
jgi:phage shock protein PspC (stress-responsive transcriptional regulator)